MGACGYEEWEGGAGIYHGLKFCIAFFATGAFVYHVAEHLVIAGEWVALHNTATINNF